MKTGKVPESVLRRSVINRIKKRRPEILQGAAVGEDCAVIGLGSDEVYVMSTDPITGTSHEMGSLAVHVTANDIASAGAEVIGVMLSILLPEGCVEEDLKEIMEQVEEACSELDIQTIGGHTEVTRVVNQPVITVTGVGKVRRDKYITTGGARPGDDIIVTKWIGLEGTSIIAREKEEELLKRFSSSFIGEAAGFIRYLSVVPEAGIAVKHRVTAMHDITEGGVFGALWEVAEASGAGLKVDMLSIPIRQETVEICEVFDINPYELISSGSMLITAGDGPELIRDLKEAGIEATIIGKIEEGRDRILLNKGNARYLTPPGPDELYKIFSTEE
ncbi:MAG: AIR synthase family protein [Lachnospiraceae bacterium]|nr:AIR synthase family protein [Lachnospiraceae bacterium]